jgi:hypothetical protein
MRDPSAFESSGDTNTGRTGGQSRPRLIRGDVPRQVDLSRASLEQRRKRGSVRFEIDPNHKPPGGDPPAAA